MIPAYIRNKGIPALCRPGHCRRERHFAGPALLAALLILPLFVGFLPAAVAQTEGSITVSLTGIAPEQGAEGDSGTNIGAVITIQQNRAISGFGTFSSIMFNVCLGGTADREDYSLSSVINNLATDTIPGGNGCFLQRPFQSVLVSGASAYQIRVNGDTDIESDETVIISLSRIPSTPDNLVIDLGSITFTIQNDDFPPLVDFNPGVISLTEDGTASYTVVLNTPPANNVQIAVAPADPLVATVSPMTLTFAPNNWSTAQTVTVTGADNDIVSSSESTMVDIRHTVDVGDGGSYTSALMIDAVSATVTDDDEAGLFIFETAITSTRVIPVTIDEPTSLTFTVALTSEPTANVTLGTEGFLGDELTLDIDSGLTFTPGNWDTAQTVTLTALDDDNIENETREIFFTIGGASEYVVLNFFISMRITINDDDMPEVTIAGGAAVMEGGGDAATFTLTAEPAPTADLTVTVAVAEEAGQDFVDAGSEGTGRSVTIGTSGTAEYTVAITDDDVDESNGTITVAIEASSDYTVGDPGTATVVVNDDDVAGLDISETAVRVDEEGSSTYTVALTSEPTADVTVTITGASASLTVDTGSTLTFDDTNWSDVQTVTLTASGDVNMDNENFDLMHRASGATEYSSVREDVTVSVIDNDSTPPEVTIAGGAAVMEGSGDAATFTLTAEPAPTADLTVTVAVAEEAGQDFVDAGTEGAGRSVTIGTSGTAEYTVAITDDDVDESNGTITVTIEAGSDYTVGDPGTATVVVNDDDVAGVTVTQSEGDTEVAESGGTDSYTVVLTSEPAVNVEITVTSDDTDISRVAPNGGAFAASTVLTFTATTWNQAQTVRVQGVDDDIENTSDRTVAIGHAVSVSDADSGYSAGLSIDAVSVTVTDDDTAGLDISETAVTVDEEGSITYTVALTSEPTADVTVTITGASEPLTVDTGTGGTLTFDDTNWSDVQTVTLTAADDANMDGETFTLVHTASGSATEYGSVSRSVTVRVNDNDSTLPEVTIAGGAAVTEGSGDAATFTLTADPAPSAELTVTVAVAEEAGQDFVDAGTEGTGRSVTIGTSGTAEYTVAITDNDVDESNGTITVTIEAGSDYTVGDPGTATVVVNDDDVAGLDISETAVTVDEEGSSTYTVALTTEPTADVTVTITGASDPLTVDTGSTLTFDDTNWSDVQTVTLTAADDDNMDEETFILVHTASGSATEYGSVSEDVTVRVIDNDAVVQTAGVTVSTDSLEIREDRQNTYTVELNSVPDSDVVITVTSEAPSVFRLGTGADTGGTITLTFSTGNWSQPQQVTVAGVNDDIDNLNDMRTGTITHVITTGDGGDYDTLGIDPVSVTVLDEDIPSIRITAGSSVEEGDTATFIISLISTPEQSEKMLTISLMVSETTGGNRNVVPPAAEGAQTVEIPPNTGSVTYTIRTQSDRSPLDGQITVEVELAPGTDLFNNFFGTSYLIIDSSASVDVTDDGSVTASLDISETAVTVDEEGSSTYTVALTSEPTADVTVTITGASDPLTVDTGATLTFDDSNWSDVQTVTLTAADDANVDDETFILVHTASGSAAEYGSVREDVTVRVIDNDLPVVTIAGGAAVTEGSGEGGTFTLTVVPAPSAELTITVAVAEEAGQGQDFVDAGNEGAGRSVTIDTSGTVEYTVAITDDDVDESNGAITVTIEAGSDYTVGDPGTATVVVNDDDVAGVTVTQSEGNTEVAESGGTDSYTVVLTSEPAADVEITVTSDDTDISSVAPNGGAFAASTVLTFTATTWNQAQTVRVQGVDDDIKNASDRTVAIGHEISAPDADSGYPAALDIADVTVTVTDDDTAGLDISAGSSVTVDEEGSSTYTVALTSEPTADVTVTITGASDPLMVDTGATLTFDDTNWSDVQTVTLTAADDANMDDETLILAHTASGSATEYGSVSEDVTVTVNDDDTAGLDISETAVTVDEEGSSTYTVALTSEPTADVTVTITGASDPLMVDTGATLTFDDTNWSDVQTVTLTAADDANMDDETLILVHTASGSAAEYGSVSEDVTVNVIDNDAIVQTAGVTVSTDSLLISEDGQNTYTVRLNSEPDSDVVITVTSEAPSVFTLGTGRTVLAEDTSGTITLTFSTENWSEPQRVTVAGVNDDIDNLNDRRIGSITHVITTGDGGDYDDTLDIDPVIVTATDEDTPTIEITAGSSIEEGDTATFIISLTRQSEKMLTISLMVEEDTLNNRNVVPPAAEGDQTVEIPPNTGSVTYTIRTQSDRSPLDGEITVEVVLASGTNFGTTSYFGIGNNASVDVTDDGSFRATLSIDASLQGSSDTGNAFTVTEGDSNARTVGTFTVRLSRSWPVDVSYSACHIGTAEIGVNSDALVRDQLPLNSLRNLNARGCYGGVILSGVQSFTLRVEVVGDMVFEPDETVHLELRTSAPNIDIDPTAGSITFTIQNDDLPMPGVTVTESDDDTTVDESGGTDSYSVVLATQPTANVTITADAGAGVTVDNGEGGNTLTFTSMDWDTAQTITVTGVNDDSDTANREVTIGHTVTSGDSEYSALRPGDVVVTVTDDDPTVVNLTRTGGTGAIEEGGTVNFSITLSRALVAGETIDVPLSIAGAVVLADWTLALLSGADNTGVTLSVETTVMPRVSFSGDGAETAELQLTAVSDSDIEDSERIVIALGDDTAFDDGALATNVGGGADPASPPNEHFSLVINDVVVTPPEVTIAGGAAVMEGSGDAATFTLTADPAPTADLTVTVAVAEEAGQDFVDAGTEGTGRSVTIGTSGMAEYTVAITDNDVDESNGTITVTIEAGSDYTVGDPGTATVVVNDDDTAGLDISEAAVAVDEEGSSTYTVALTTEPTADVTVTITGASDPLTVDTGATLTFDDTNWSDVQTVTLTAADDADRDDETFILVHTASGSATEYGSVSEDVTVRVNDDDVAGLDISETAVMVDEEGSSTYTVALTTEPTADVTVTITGASASLTVDPGATLTFDDTNWSDVQTVTLTAADDANMDGETFILVHTASGSAAEYGSVREDVTVRVIDNDSTLPEVTIAGGAAVTEGSGDAATFTLTAEPAPSAELTVTVAVAEEAGQDFVDAGTEGTGRSVTIGTSGTAEYTVAITDNDVDESNGTITVTIEAGSDYTVGDPGTATVVVNDDDVAGVTVTQSEGDTEVTESGGIDSYTVVLTSEPAANVEITVTSGDTDISRVAPNSGAFTASTVLTFTATTWNQAQMVRVQGVDDDVANTSDRTVVIGHEISAPDADSGYPADRDIADVTVTVTDDDEAGVMIAQSAGNTVVAELGGMDSYTMVLSSEPAGNIVISVTSGEVTAATVEPMVLTFTTATWNVAQTVTVTGVNDDIGNEGGQRIVTVSHAVTTDDAGSGYPADLSIDAVSVTVTDDDEANVTIAQTGAGTSVAELGGTDSYTVVLNTEPTGDVVIDVTSDEVTAATVEPTALTFTMETWNVAQTVTVTGEDDDIDNVDDRRVVNISHAVRAGGSGGYDAVSIAEVSVSVEDDDEASLIFLPDVVRVDEASEQSYEVSLGTQPIGNVTVTISGSGGATGLRLDDDELTFTAGNWNEPQEVTVSAAPDDDMDNEVVTLMHRASAGYGAPATGQVEVRVTDDDIALPGVQVSPTQVTVDENGGVSGYDVVLRTRPLGDVEIELSVSGAASAADVGPLSLSFTPTDWDVAQAVRVTGVNDDIDSADRMLDIGHTITTNDGGSYTVALSIDSVSVRVEDDDEAGAHVNPGIVTVNESVGMGSYTVVLTSQPLGNSTVTIGLASRDSTAAIVSPASLSFTSMNWDEAVRVTVTGVNDEVDNAGDVRVLDIVHAVTAGDGVGYRAGATVLPAATVIVEDDGDDAGLLLDVDERNADGTLSLIEQGDSRHYRVRLSSQPLSDVTVTITGAGSSLRVDAGGAGNSLTFTTMNWSEVQTVTLTAVDDGNLSGERVTLPHAASGGGYDGVTGELTVLIADNDRMSGVSIDSDALRVDEAGDMAMAFYTVVLDAQPSGDVEIGVSSDMTSAATVNPAVLRFTTANWNLRQRVTVTGEDDDIDNAGDGRMALITHTVRLSDGAGYPVDLTIDDVMVSVMDDDEAGLVFEPERVFIAEEGDSRNYGVRLSSQPTGDVTVTVNDAVGGLSVDTGGMPVNSLTFSRMNWRVAQNVMVLAFDDGNEVTETVTLTHTAVGGDYDSVTGGVDVVIADNDRAAGVSVDETVVSVSEGETVIYTVVLDSEPRSDVEIRVTSSDSRIASVSPLTALTFTSDNWNEPQEVRVSGIDDAIDRADRMVSVDHAVSTGDSGGYNAGLSIESVSVTVLDDDERGLVLNRSTLGVVEDGASVAYTVSLSSQPTGDVMVTVNGAVGGLSVDTGGMPVNSLTFSSMNWRVAQNVMVRAVDDGNEVTETVTLTHTAVGGDYDLMMARSLMVRIADDESMMAGVSVSERRVTVEESGGTATYRIHLDSPPMGNVVVNVLSTDMQAAKVEPVSVGFTPLNWGEEQLVTVTGVDDDVDNGAFRTVRIEHRIVAGDGVGYRTGLSIESLEVRVTDDEGRSAGGDEEQAQMQAAQAAQEVWLSHFGLTAVEHMLGGLDYRFSSSRRAGLSGNVKGLPNGGAGQALSGEGVSLVRSLGVDGFGHGRAVGVGSGHDGFGAGSVDRLFKLSRSLSLPNMLRGSRFTYTDEGGTSVWGQASYSSYAGSPGEVSVKGDVTTAMLGMDRELGRTLLGLALAYSDGDGDWDDAGSGEFSSKLTSLLPYVRYDVTDRLRFWGAASYGQGELEQTSSRGSVSTHDLEQVSASAGLRGTLMQSALEEGGLTLTLISEATLVRTETDDSAEMAGMETDTHRFRMGLEWSWQSAETNGIRFTPELELGVRYDGGDTNTGLGIELGGGVSWEAPLKGLALDLRGRRLLEHEDSERDEWGISGSLRFKLRPGSSHGPSLSLSQEYGNTTASSGLDRLLSGSLSDALEEDTSRAGEVSSRWTLKGEWGFALDGGATGVPYAGLSSSGDKRDLTLGWRLSSPGDDLDTKLDVRAMRREKKDSDANHSIGAELKVNW